MDLSIRTTPALIGIDRTPESLEIQTRSAQLELHQKQAKVNIHTELSRVIIDQYECFASAGLKGNADLSSDAASRGYQQSMGFIGKTAADGNRLAAIENGGNPIAQIAVRDAYPIHEFGLDFIPKVGPKIDVTGSQNFELERNSEDVNNGVEGNYIPSEINMSFRPANVSVYLKQYAAIEINYVGNTIDSYI